MLFTCIKSWFFRNHLANFHRISHWSFCWNVIDSLFKWSCSIDCQAHIFFFKTKNCSSDDIFISCGDRIGKMLHNICMSAVAMSLRWANCGPWASFFFILKVITFFLISPQNHMFKVLIWSALVRGFWLVPQHMFVWRNKKKKKYWSWKASYSELWVCVQKCSSLTLVLLNKLRCHTHF